MPNRDTSRTKDVASKYAGVHSAVNGGPVSYSGIDGDLLRDTIQAVTNDGDALLFGRTSDGGALSVQVLSGGTATRFYPSDVSELYEVLEGLRNACNAV